MAGTAPILVLGLGNLLLGDDGVGLRLLERLAADETRWRGLVEFVDGGTQGMALLGRVEGREALVLLDAVALGSPPGTVHALAGDEVMAACTRPGQTAHELGAGELLRAAALVCTLPPVIALVGVEPASVASRVGLSVTVEASVELALHRAVEVIAEAASAVAKLGASTRRPAPRA
jgi:hydrogenase maturation protease